MTRLALAAALLALPLPAAAQVAAQPAVMIDGTILDVSARGQTARVPDLATIRAGVVASKTSAGRSQLSQEPQGPVASSK